MKIEEILGPKLEKILRPDWRKLVVFLVFLFIIGVINHLVFYMGLHYLSVNFIENPLVFLYYAIISPFSTLVYAPIRVIFESVLFRNPRIIIGIFEGMFSISDLIYKYVLACLLIFIYDNKLWKVKS